MATEKMGRPKQPFVVSNACCASFISIDHSAMNVPAHKAFKRCQNDDYLRKVNYNG